MEHLRPVDAALAPVDKQQLGHSSDLTSVPVPGTFVVCQEDAEQTPTDVVDETLALSPEAQPGPSGLEPLDQPGSSRAIGPYCTQAGLTQDHFTQDDTLDLPVQDSIKKGLVLELNRFLTKTLKYTRRQVVDVLAMLAGSKDGQHFDGLDDNPSSRAPTLERRKWKFSLSPEEQRMIWVYKGRHNNSLKGHTKIFAKKVSEVNPYCVLIFKFNRVKKFGSRKKRAPFFHGKAVCKFDGCTEYDFVIKKAHVEGKDLKVKVRISGDIIHGEDFQHLRLIICDSKRNNQSRKAKLNLQQLAAESCHAEKQNGIPSIPSTANQSNSVDFDVFKELLKVSKKTEEMGSIGYIQYLSMIPFGIIVFTDAQLKILIEKIKDELVTLHLGETGSLIKGAPDQSNGMQYCALVASGHGNNPPLPLAEFISYGHTEPEFNNFLMRFGDAVQQLDERYCVPHKVIVDCRWDAIQAVTLSFNHMGTRCYLENVWDGSPPVCKVYICSAHLMHVVSRHLGDTETSRNKFILQCVARMIDTTSKDEVDNIFSMMCKVLLSKVPPGAETMQQLKSETTFEYDKEREVYKESTFPKESDDCLWLTTSPYYKHYQSIKITHEGKWGRSTDKNPYYAPEFVRYFLQTFMSIAPLWTGIVDAAPPATNAMLTDWFQTVKRDIISDEKRLRLGQIVQAMADSLHGRIREYQLASLSNALRRPHYDGEKNHQGMQQGNSLEQNSQPQAKTRTTNARRNKAKRLKKD